MSFAVKMLLAIAAGGAVFAGMGWLVDWRAMVAALSSLEPSYIPVVMALILANYFLRFIKWHYYLKIVGVEARLSDSVAIFVTGFMMAVSPGKLGEVVKAYLLKKMYGVKMRVTAPVILAERITDVIALLALCLGGAGMLQYGRETLLATAVVTALGIAALSSRRLAMLAIGICERLPVADRIADKLHSAYDSMAALLRPVPLVLATLVSIPAWATEGAAFYVIFLGMDQGAGTVPPLMGAIFVYALGTLAGAASMLPGGIGAAEAGLAGFTVTLFGIPSAVAGAATLVVRIVTLWFAVALGAAVFAAWRGRFGIGFSEVDSVPRSEEAATAARS